MAAQERYQVEQIFATEKQVMIATQTVSCSTPSGGLPSHHD